jgi:hypothetical protein
LQRDAAFRGPALVPDVQDEAQEDVFAPA